MGGSMKRLVLFSCLMFACLLLNAAGIIVNSGNTSLQFATLQRCNYDVNIENQIAVVTVTETFKNNLSSNMAPRFYYPMPDGASATQLRWSSFGNWYTATISPNPQNPPGGPSYLPTYFTDYVGAFPIVFDFITILAPADTMTVELTYVQLLPYSGGNVDLTLRNNYIPIQSTPFFVSQSLDVSLQSDRTITAFQMLSHPSATVVNNGNNASANYILNNSIANLDYHLRYTLSSEQLGLWTMSTLRDSIPDNLGHGFFTFIAEPDPSDNTQVINKVFTLVIDRSGSMDWENKIVQAKNAASYIVNHLNEGDMFNIVAFNTSSQSLWESHQPSSPANVAAALTFINGIDAYDGTNIGLAFATAIPQFINANDDTANIIIFLTDGQPTVGITNAAQLVTYIDGLFSTNEAGIFLFNFGIGSDVNQQLLSIMADNHNGMATFLGNNEVYAAITEFYNMIRNPVMLNPTFTVNPVGSVQEVYPANLPNLYLGKQMIVSGRYVTPQTTSITFSGQAYNNQVTYEYPLVLSENNSPNYQFLPKIWAKQKIETLLIQYYLLDPNSAAGLEMRQTIVSLSLMWGIITEFTSFSGGTVNNEDETAATPLAADLVNLVNYPNPFNPATTISFDVLKEIHEPAILKIYNTKGQLIRILAVNVNGKGKYQIFWDGKDQTGRLVTCGIYFYSLKVGNTILSNKMTIMK